MAIILDKRYKIEDQIGEGGMGVVYRGIDLKTEKTIAIKQLKQEAIRAEPNLIKRFMREGEILRQLYHPNIVRRIAVVYPQFFGVTTAQAARLIGQA